MHHLRSISRLIPAIVVTTLLSACDDSNDVDAICANNEAICTDLNSDQWCQTERNTLITARFNAQEDTTGQAQYLLLSALSDFQECIKIAALIEPRTHPELKTLRVSAMLSTYDELIALEQQTLSSNDPYVLNYHWQSHNNEAAKKRFMSLAKEQHFNDPALYFSLANIYDRNTTRSITYLLKGISLLGNNNQLVEDNKMTDKLVYGLITAYMHERRYARAYLWSQVAIALEVENINLTLFNQNKLSDVDKVRITELAEQVTEQIEDKQFNDEDYEYTLSLVGF